MELKLKQFILAILVLCSLNVKSQESQIEIDKISFIGNEKTKTSFLEEIVASEPGQTIFLSTIENDVQQLKNLASIVNASYKIEKINNESVLQFIVEERRTKLPILNFGGIKNNVWFSLGLIENNFLGRGNLLFANYQNTDGRHSAEVFYRNPRNKTGKWGYSAGVRKWSSIEPLYFTEGAVDYLYDNNSLNFNLIRNFGLRKNIKLGGSIFRESYLQAEEQTLANPPGPTSFEINKFLSKLQVNYNYIDYSYFYLDGFQFNITGQNVFNFLDETFFNSIEFRAKAFFRPRKKINIASRVVIASSTNNDSPFAPFVADSHVNIRGIGNRIDRGTAQAVLNLECRYTAYHKHYWAVQCVGFSDFGTWRNPGGEFLDLVDKDNFRQFVGGGIRVIYQKVFGATLRLDYSIDVFNMEERGFVLGLGQYF